jgi:hypothetical protein
MSSSQLAFYSLNTVGKTDLATYTCTGTNAEFGSDLVNPAGNKKISINLPTSNRYVTTSAVEDLAGLEIKFYRNNDHDPKLKLQLSRDSVHWTDAITPTSETKTYRETKIIADFVPGRYYVRLTNTTSSKAISIYQIIYSFGSCNCMLYIPE